MGQLVSDSIPNLVNGVSQQPDALRLATQSALQINGYSTVVNGLSKRPPTIHTANLGTAPAGNIHVHTINRDTTERYVVTISSGALRVHDIAGNSKTVHAPNGFTYLNSVDAKNNIKAVTIADYTFILNKRHVVGLSGGRAPRRNTEAIVYVKAGNYGRTYNVHINGQRVASYTTPDGSVAAHTAQIDTTYIASVILGQIRGVFQTWGGAWNAERLGHCIHIAYTGGDFSIATEDGYGGQNMVALKGTAQKFSDLPPLAPNGYVIEIAGDQTTGFGNYYVRFKPTNSGDTSGVWVETLQPNTILGFSAGTLPHILIRNTDGTFTFKQAVWEQRKTGDEKGAPAPSFVGRTIEDIFFHRNRLGFLSDENVIFSKAGDFFTFWPTTMTTILDDDPIDVGVSHIKVSKLRYAVPFTNSLLLFSDQTQFKLSGDDLLTPKTVKVVHVSEYEIDPKVRPVNAGTSIFFAAQQGTFSSVREYYVVPAEEHAR